MLSSIHQSYTLWMTNMLGAMPSKRDADISSGRNSYGTEFDLLATIRELFLLLLIRLCFILN